MRDVRAPSRWSLIDGDGPGGWWRAARGGDRGEDVDRGDVSAVGPGAGGGCVLEEASGCQVPARVRSRRRGEARRGEAKVVVRCTGAAGEGEKVEQTQAEAQEWKARVWRGG